MCDGVILCNIMRCKQAGYSQAYVSRHMFVSVYTLKKGVSIQERDIFIGSVFVWAR